MEQVYLIYGISDCPACLRAQALLMDLDLEYSFVQMDFSKSYQQAIKQELNWTTFPIIVKIDKTGEKTLGGYDELLSSLEEAHVDSELWGGLCHL